MTSKMLESLQENFGYLLSNTGFSCAIESSSYRYLSTSLVVISSFNARDGLSTEIQLPLMGPEIISIRTILSALAVRGPAKLVSLPERARQEAGFVRDNMQKLLGMPSEIYIDCCALRFWHAYEWRKGWGTEITLDSQSIGAERARLHRIQNYFLGGSHADA